MASRTSQRRTWGKGTGPGPRARAWLGAALILAGSFPGCGYTVRNSLPSNLKTLAIPVFANNTVEFGLSDDVTRALTDAFLANRQLKIVQERDANAVLRGAVVAYKNQVFGYTSQERATQYEIVLTVQATFRDMIRNRDLWREDALTVRTTYNVVAVGGQPAQTELDGRKDVIQKLADQIVSRTVQGW
ncbi:MAG TPA: LptE family protein [Candidatus Dormibacteraeota bacterium]|nr:LptE family protein [Candidatus Dormibacteraeota bacterium]